MTCCAAVPAEITAGLDFQVTLSLAAYPAPTWVVSLVMRGPESIDLVAAASGSDHVLTASAATTAGWTAGTYWFSLRATSAGQVAEAGKGQVEILPDLAAVTGVFDGRTENEKALEAIDAVLAKKATRDQQRYVIGNREIWRVPVRELMQLRAYYAAAVRRERAKARGCSPGFGRRINVNFSSQ